MTDPIEGITNSYLYAVSKLGLKEENPEIIATYIGPPLHYYFAERHNIKSEEMENAVKLYREYYAKKGIYENLLYDGIKELLDNLNMRKNNIFLVTGKPTVYAKEILNHFGIQKFFKNIYGSELAVKNATKDVLIHKAISNENLHSLKSVMVGDRHHDIDGAKENGIDSIAVTYGYGSIEELKNAAPTYIANTVKELETILI